MRYYNRKTKTYDYVDYNSLFTLDQRPCALTSDQAVLNCFYNLIVTTPGDLYFEPTFGSGIVDMLFDPAISNKALRVFNKVFSACVQWLPMITVYKNQCTLALDAVKGVCKLKFVLSINQASPVTLGLIISE